MINANVLKAMDEQEVISYVRQLEHTVVAHQTLYGAEDRLKSAYKAVVEAIDFEKDAQEGIADAKADLRGLTIELEKKYKDQINKPILSDDTLPF